MRDTGILFIIGLTVLSNFMNGCEIAKVKNKIEQIKKELVNER